MTPDLRGAGNVKPVHAVILTFRRPRLATEVVLTLVDGEGFDPGDITLVINHDGGLFDPALEKRLNVLRLNENVGPAGGFAAGFTHAARSTSASWIYVCEDDGSLRELPTPRVHALLERVERFQAASLGQPVGAVVVHGRDVNPSSGASARHRPASPTFGLEEVDWGPWHGALVSRAVLDADVLPEADLFWGSEDFDFFLRLRRSGFRVLMDVDAARAVSADFVHVKKSEGRVPKRRDEPWCSYYLVRNPLVISRRHGRLRWIPHHLVSVARRFRGATNEQRRAIALGVWHGIRGRAGKDSRFEREVGELEPTADGIRP